MDEEPEKIVKIEAKITPIYENTANIDVTITIRTSVFIGLILFIGAFLYFLFS